MRLAGAAQFHDAVGYGVQRFVPGYGHKAWIFLFAFAGIGPLHGDLDPVGVVDLLQRHVGAHARIDAVDLRIGVSPHFDGAAVFDVDLGGAPGGAPLAGGGSPLAALNSGRRLWRRGEGL